MEKKIVLEKLNQLVIAYNEGNAKEKVLNEMELLLEGYLIKRPNDEDMLIRLALVEFTIPFADYGRAIYYLERVLSTNPNNIKALLMMAYNQYVYYGIRTPLLHRLESFRTQNKEYQSLLWYAQSLYYLQPNFDPKHEKNALIQSLSYYQGFVWPNVHLGDCYEKLGNIEKSCAFFKSALKNVEVVYKEDDIIDILSIDRFIDAYLKGTHQSPMNYDQIKMDAINCEKNYNDTNL